MATSNTSKKETRFAKTASNTPGAPGVDRVAVKFSKTWKHHYNPGEIAVFKLETAKTLVDSGIAAYHQNDQDA